MKALVGLSLSKESALESPVLSRMTMSTPTIAMIAIVGVLMVILLKTGDSNADSFESDNPTSAFIEGFYNADNPYGQIPGLTPKEKDPNAPVGDAKNARTRPRPNRQQVIAGS